MKLQNELNPLIERLETIKTQIPEYAKQLKASKNYNDFETRLSWDCLKAVTAIEIICTWYEKYNCHDSHITTLAKTALKAVYTITE